MYTHTRPHAVFNERLQASLGRLAERVAVSAPGAERSRLLRWVLVAVAIFALWRFGRGLKTLCWAMFGIAMAFWWTGGAAWFFSR